MGPADTKRKLRGGKVKSGFQISVKYKRGNEAHGNTPQEPTQGYGEIEVRKPSDRRTMFIEFSMSQDTDDEKGGEASKNSDEIIRSDKVEGGCDEKNFWPKYCEQLLESLRRF